MSMVSKSSRHVLIAVTGLSPAVITETIWGLATKRSNPVIADHIVVITTTIGAQRIKETILAPGEWKKFDEEVTLASGLSSSGKIAFGTAQDHLRIIPSPHKNSIATDAFDIRSAADHEAAAEFIMRTVREFSEDAGTKIIFSVAGGRKTMGSILFSVANLLGRPGDRITHVLVNEPYENPAFGFLYPGRAIGSEPIPQDSPAPIIELAEIPFVPLRQLFTRNLGGRISSYMDLVRDLQGEANSYGEVQSLIVDTNAQAIGVNGGKSIKISHKAFVLMLGYATLARDGDSHHHEISNVIDAIRTAHAQYGKDCCKPWKREAILATEDNNANWQCDVHKSLSGLRTRLIEKLNLTRPQVDRIVPHRERMSINLAPSAIRIK